MNTDPAAGRKARKKKRREPEANHFASDRPFEQLRVRRAPKYVPFLVAGAVLGVIAAILLAVIPGDVKYGVSTVFGFFLVVLAVVGAGLGGVVALVIDWIGRRKQRRIKVAELPETAARVDNAAAPEDPAQAEPDEQPEARQEDQRGRTNGID